MRIGGARNSPDLTPAPSTSIVVGHDGSRGANAALEVALQLAEQLFLPVALVRAWSIATAPRPADWEFGYVSTFDQYSAAVCHELEQDARPLIDVFSTVSVSYYAAHASPAPGLIALSRNTRLLVVGTRGYSGLAGVLLGSVSRECARRAECLVLVVPPPT